MKLWGTMYAHLQVKAPIQKNVFRLGRLLGNPNPYDFPSIEAAKKYEQARSEMMAIKTHAHELRDHHVSTCRDITARPGNTEKAKTKLVAQGGATQAKLEVNKVYSGNIIGG